MESIARPHQPVNNAIYSHLGSRWYEAKDDPIALLRAESRQRNPWIAQHLARTFGGRSATVLDLGCGGGLLSNDLAARGHHVTGLDASAESLEIAAQHDRSGTVRYELGDALALRHADASFDAVCAMDFLEHVEDPARVIAEAARVLRPGGLFFFHTFDRNWLSWLVIIKGVEWFVKNTPRDLHVLRLFLKPDEVTSMCAARGLEMLELRGSRPVLGKAFWRMLRTGTVSDDFAFTFTGSTRLAYTGVAQRTRELAGRS